MAHVEKRGKDRWRARYRAPDGRERSRTFPRRSDAERFLSSVTSAVVSGEWVDPDRGRLLVGAWVETWLAGRADLRAKTRAGYESVWRRCIAPRWADVPLGRVEHQAVAAWVADLAARYSASRTRQAYGVLRQALDAAVRDRRIPRNPAVDVRLPRMPEQRKRFLSYGEVEQLAQCAGDDGLLVRFLAVTGIRWGEATALRMQDIDLMRRRVRVERSLSDVNGALSFGPTKNNKRREVPLPRFLGDELAQVLAGRAPDALVFVSPEGQPLRAQNFRRRVWLGAVERSGLDALTVHDLRHTAASLAVASGASVLAVSRMLGHSAPSVTLDVYAGLFESSLDALTDRLDEAFWKARAASVRPGTASEVVEFPQR